MKFANLVKNADGGFSWFAPSRWTSGEREVARIEPSNGHRWRIRWHSWFDQPRGALRRGFESAVDACSAAEIYWPPRLDYEGAWIKTLVPRGYFRKIGKKITLHVRSFDDGLWLAFRWDWAAGTLTLLGKGGVQSRFATAEDTCRAVEQALRAPEDEDDFRDTSDRWCWVI